MNQDNSTPFPIKAKRTYTAKKVIIPSHDCQPEITLMVAGKDGVVHQKVAAGVDLASTWLKAGHGLRLDEEMQRLRKVVGELSWPTIELGFLARMDQRLSALETNYPVTNVHVNVHPAAPPEPSTSSLIVGNETMRLMLDQLNSVAALARCGELRPSSQEAGQALAAIAELVGCIEMVGPVTCEQERP